jgi:DNA-binding response OmpR family regulator
MTGYTMLMLTDDSYPYLNLGWVMQNNGCRILKSGAAETLLEAIHTRELDLVLARITREGGAALAVLKQAKRLQPRVRVILCSGDRETAFPPEAYELEVDDYLFMPCSMAELCRRVARALKRLPGKSPGLAVASRFAPINRRVFEKSRRALDYFRYNLGSCASALKTMSKTPGARGDEKLMGKIAEVSARLEICQEMTDALLRGFSRETPVNGFLGGVPLPGKAGGGRA